jgi:hypothetical protein
MSDQVKYYGSSWTMGPHTVEELERRRSAHAPFVMGVQLGYTDPDHPQRLVDLRADDWRGFGDDGSDAEAFLDGFFSGVCWHEQYVGEVM